MAITDVFSTNQRVSQLTSAKKDIDAAIQQCKLAENAFGRLNSQSGWVDFKPKWDEIQSGMSAASDIADIAIAKLNALKNDGGYVFRYRWEIGKAGVEEIGFVSGFKTIGLASDAGATNEFSSTAGVIPQAGDKLLINGTTSNDSILTVDSGSSANSIIVTNSITTETCSARGASITLIRRGT